MLNLQGGRLLRLFDLLYRMEKLARTDPIAAHGNGTFRKSLDYNVKMLINLLEMLDAPVSIKHARTILMYSSAPKSQCDPPAFVELVSRSLEELRERIKDELDDRTFHYLQPRHAKLFLAGQDAFGDEVVAAFPRASTDMAEAVACMVWGRHTACVFHLMRVMEISLYEVGEKLGVTIVSKNGEFREWGAITRQMDDAIKNVANKDEKRRWSEVRALLDHVRHCWRNATMHPRRTYTHEEALAVFDAVKSYLRSVSTLVSGEA